MKFEVGQIIEHHRFGIGRVQAVDGTQVSVWFRDVRDGPEKKIDTRYAALTLAEDQSVTWAMPAAERRTVAKTRRPKAARADEPPMPIEELIQRFLNHYPGGFEDAEYLGTAGPPNKATGERNYKLAAIEQWRQTLGRDAFADLLAGEDYSEICRRSLAIEQMTNLLSTFEKIAFKNVLEPQENHAMFAKGLFDLIYGEDSFEARFERFAEMLGALPTKGQSAAKWPIQTFFPFIAMPEEHIGLKPEVTKLAAKRVGIALNYKPAINWLTYRSLLELAEVLKEKLASLNPKDMVDIHSFIWVTGRDGYTKK